MRRDLWSQLCILFSSLIQPKLVQAKYWKDARDIDSYLKYNTFIADINNEGSTKNQTYVKNIAALENFVMVRFNRDSMVVPTETSWFGFYTPGQATEIQRLNETTLYKEVSATYILTSSLVQARRLK